MSKPPYFMGGWGVYYKLLWVRIEWRHFFKFEFSKFTFSNLFLIAFGGVFNSTHFVGKLHSNQFLNSLYNWKEISNFDVILKVYGFSFFEQKVLFLSPYRGKSRDHWKSLISSNFLCKKFLVIFGFPCKSIWVQKAAIKEGIK